MRDALRDVEIERLRQEELREAGKFAWTCSAANIHPERKLSVLGEEVGEVCKEVVDLGIVEGKYKAEGSTLPRHRRVTLLLRMRKELVQVAAVCAAWCETGGLTTLKEILHTIYECTAWQNVPPGASWDRRLLEVLECQGRIALRVKSSIHIETHEADVFEHLVRLANVCLGWIGAIDLQLSDLEAKIEVQAAALGQEKKVDPRCAGLQADGLGGHITCCGCSQ